MTGVLKSPIVAIALFIAVVVVVAGILFFVDDNILIPAIAFFTGIQKAGPALWRRLFWKSAEGEVVGLCKATTLELPSVVYRYRVAGQEYEGSANENPKWHKKWQKIDIDYKPDQPAISRYTSDFSEFVIGWGFIVVGLIFVFLLQ